VVVSCDAFRGRLAGAALATVLCAFANAGAETEERQLTSVGPLVYGFLTLGSGHTFKYLGAGPVFGKEGKRLGLGVSYVTDAINLEQLEAEAGELFEYARPQAESQREEGVVIIANIGFEPGKGSPKTFNVVYTREASGKWKALPRVPSHRLPTIARSSSHLELIRDVDGEKKALADAQAWLALSDAGHVTQSWDAAAPLFKGWISQDKWATIGSAWNDEFGKVKTRILASTLSTRIVLGAPEGLYVTFEYHSKFTNRPNVFEQVVEMLCEDGKWRVAGYHRR
jgi:hypothetical protein